MKAANARLILALAGSVALATCASAAARPSAPPAPVAQDPTPAPSVEVRIVNNTFYDANVYVLTHDAVVRRLGTVEGYSRRTFVLTGPQAAPGAQLALYARTIGEGREFRSDVVMIFLGKGLQWELEASGLEWLNPKSSAH